MSHALDIAMSAQSNISEPDVPYTHAIVFAPIPTNWRPWGSLDLLPLHTKDMPFVVASRLARHWNASRMRFGIRKLPEWFYPVRYFPNSDRWGVIRCAVDRSWQPMIPWDVAPRAIPLPLDGLAAHDRVLLMNQQFLHEETLRRWAVLVRLPLPDDQFEQLEERILELEVVPSRLARLQAELSAEHDADEQFHNNLRKWVCNHNRSLSKCRKEPDRFDKASVTDVPPQNRNRPNNKRKSVSANSGPQSTKPYCPSPEEIAAACAEIQAEWPSGKQRRKLSGRQNRHAYSVPKSR